MRSTFKRLLPLLMLTVFILALASVFRQLHGYHWHDLIAQIRQMSYSKIGLAFLLTVAGYLLMTIYDFLALKYIDHPLPYAKTALASGLSYAFSNNVGFAMLAGASIRYRIYSAWGLSAVEITQIIIFCSLSLWLGFVGMSGIIFLFEPLTLPSKLNLPFNSLRPIGLLLFLIFIGYAVLSFRLKKEIVIKDWHFTLPSYSIAMGQLLVALTDWFLAGMVLYVLWPHPSMISSGHFLVIFMLAQLAGLISQVPGGVGIFESTVLLLAASDGNTPKIASALIVYRGIYYLMPLMIAIIVLGVEEVLHRKQLFTRARDMATRVWATTLIPILSLAVFFTGAILLFSGSLPAKSVRLHFLEEVIPLPLLEASHFLGSLAGMGLLLLARGIQRRLDAAYLLTLILLGIGIAASLLKGLDYEEAMFLMLVFLVLLPSRPLFYRHSSLFSERFSMGWIAAIAAIVITTIWLGLFSFRHVTYARDLWWQFSLKGDAPRFMRAGVGITALILAFSLKRLLRPSPPKPHRPDQKEITVIQTIVHQSSNAAAHLALLGDKHFLINSAHSAFIMYGVSGESWISMGDPIGPKTEWSELIWQFHQNAKRYADRTIFYEVAHHNLHLYLDIGLVALKLGEEARVALTDFSLEGKSRKNLRYTRRRLTKQGCTFELIPADGVKDQLATLKMISEAWLAEKNTREKGFSLGFFNADYLCQTPIALVKMADRPVAFANVWQGADQNELTVDLMRHLSDAPNGVMDYLFIEMMLWGHLQGYRWFNLGMAPLSGMETRAAAPLWHKLGHMVMRYGEHFYNFKGLRQYKEKFEPVWTPKYLVCPGGLGLPRILADIGALVSGGIKGIILK
jgi:phosphatidylglycerol lysyltransferase